MKRYIGKWQGKRIIFTMYLSKMHASEMKEELMTMLINITAS